MKTFHVVNWFGTLVVITSLFFVCDVHAKTVILKSGSEVRGDIVRTDESNVTIRTSCGYETYEVRELDQKWVDDHYEKLFRETRQRRVDEVKGFISLIKGLLGKESLANATPFLTEYSKYVVPVAGGLVVTGLVCCFFGWRTARSSTCPV